MIGDVVRQLHIYDSATSQEEPGVIPLKLQFMDGFSTDWTNSCYISWWLTKIQWMAFESACLLESRCALSGNGRMGAAGSKKGTGWDLAARRLSAVSRNSEQLWL